ncbi:TPA: glycerol-3-phosphate dehydrogenase, partial [Burkholderia cenocepacia]
ASAVAVRDLYGEGRTLERLGLAALSKDALRALLDAGYSA